MKLTVLCFEGLIPCQLENFSKILENLKMFKNNQTIWESPGWVRIEKNWKKTTAMAIDEISMLTATIAKFIDILSLICR